ncbi:hypothetical protein BH09BAC5_BH09BAC5_13090 [soil metagenome]
METIINRTMNITQKKNQAITLISKMDETHLDALLLLLNKPLAGEYELSESEWAETERRLQEVKKGKVKTIPARSAVRRIEASLKKSRS